MIPEEHEAVATWNSMNALERELLGKNLIAQIKSLPTLDVDLFHYASPEALDGIIRNRAVWFTNTAYMNDQGELTYPLDLARPILREFWEQADDLGQKQFIASCARSLEGHVFFKNWYIASFSTEGDLLSQWRAYCSRGGYSIGFKGSELANNIPERGRVRIGPVIYDRDAQIHRIRTTIGDHLTYWKDFRAAYKDTPQNEYNQNIGVSLNFMLTYDFIFFKSPAFSEEHEWRMAQQSGPTTKIQFRERQGLLTPYFVRELVEPGQLLPLSKIFISPLADPDLAAHAATILLEQNGYANGDAFIQRPQYRLRF